MTSVVACVVSLIAVRGVVRKLGGASICGRVGRYVGSFHSPYYAGTRLRRCGNSFCRYANPTQADFCRRCGSALDKSAVFRRLNPVEPPAYDPVTGMMR